MAETSQLSALRRLAREGRPESYAPDHQICVEGAQAECLYLIEGGTVLESRSSSYGRYEISRRQAGDLLCEASWIDGGLIRYTCSALTTVKLRVIPFKELKLLELQDVGFRNAILWYVWKSLADRLRQLNLNLCTFFSPEALENTPFSPGTWDEVPARRLSAGRARSDQDLQHQFFWKLGMPKLEISFLASKTTVRSYKSSEWILTKEDREQEMFWVVQGSVMISLHIPGGGEEALAILEPGDHFGEMALLDDEPRCAEARVLHGEVVVAKLAKQELEGILSPTGGSSHILLRRFCMTTVERIDVIAEKFVSWLIMSGSREELDLAFPD